LVPGAEPTDDLVKELQDHVKETTAPYKYPRIVEFVEELPKTIGGKIKRAQIRATDKGDTWEG
jgi:acetyl-CoA synthetase